MTHLETHPEFTDHKLWVISISATSSVFYFFSRDQNSNAGQVTSHQSRDQVHDVINHRHSLTFIAAKRFNFACLYPEISRGRGCTSSLEAA